MELRYSPTVILERGFTCAIDLRQFMERAVKVRAILLTASLIVMGVVPAFAVWERIGSIDVSYRHDRDARNFALGGPVDSIQLRAMGSDIDCRGVRAEFGNGNSRAIFHGRLHQGEERNLDLPGRDRDIKQIVFNCGARKFSGGRIQISANIGNHRDEWRRNPDFARMWSHLLNWGQRPDADYVPGSNRWDLIGTERFEGRRDIETSVAGWRGRRVEAIALKPVDANARCRRVTARFGNGNSRDLDLPGDRVLRQGGFQRIDLPGDVRNIESISLSCRAIDARDVRIQVFVGKP
jgi:hypothetical protein